MTDHTDLKRLRRRLDMLPMATRAVFLLHRIDGLRYAEIGWRLGISRARVMCHMARAIYVMTWGPNGDGSEDDDPAEL